jgi:ribosomal protein S18 acetylase RimI-like enzyme
MSSASYHFRRATPQDVTAIVALVESAYRGDQSREGWTTEAELLDGQRTDAEEIEAITASEHARIVLAECAGELLGSMLLVPEPGALYLGMLAVRPLLQGRGVGRALIGEAERVAHAEARTCLRMTVIGQRTELIAWYARHGFALTGEREPFPYGQPRFGLPKRPDLYFAVLEKRLDGGRTGT